MDFDLEEDHAEVRELASKIFSDLATVERVVHVEHDEGGFDRKLWDVLAKSGMIGIALPETAGGSGLGMLGLVAILEQQGKRVAPVPLWSVVAGAALPIAQFGSPAQVEQWIPGTLDGSTLVTGAFEAMPGQRAVMTAHGVGEELVVSGEISQVMAAGISAAVVVPISLRDGSIRVAVVPTDRAGVTVTPVAVTSCENAATMTFADVNVGAADLLPDDGSEIVDWTRKRIRVALSAIAIGVCEEALRITAAYTSERVQFGRPLSTNQAVAMRAADAYLDTEATRLTTYRAAWLLDSGAEQAADSASMVAKWWASAGGLRVVHATQHLHGGIGADIEYPIHRYFLWGRQIAFSAGSANGIAADLGSILESAPRIGAVETV